jgi:hypothetical protein
MQGMEVGFDHLEGSSAGQIAYYSAGAYGLIFAMNFLYYSDIWYWRYTQSMYGKSGLAFKTLYGSITYVRMILETFIWLCGLLLWTGTLTGSVGMIVLFDHFVYVLNYITIGKFVLLILFYTAANIGTMSLDIRTY